MSHDAIVIGAGLQGCAVALRLAQRGQSVLLLERAVPGAEASSAAAGILSPSVEAEEPGPFHALCRASLARYPGWIAELEQTTAVALGFQVRGTLQVASDDSTARVLAARAERLLEQGFEAEVLDGDQVHALEPALTPRVRGGLYFAREASVDPARLARALYIAATKAGVATRAGQALAIVEGGGRVRGVEHTSGFLEAPTVVLAAGSWSPLVAGNRLPVRAVRPLRGQIVCLETQKPVLSRVVFTEKGYVVPRADGRVLCGSTMEEAGYQKAVTAGGVHAILDGALELCPALEAARLLETWSNFRPASPDGWPILGRSSLPGLVYASGHTRNGVLLCPITAELLCAEILGERAALDLAPFSYERLEAAPS